MPIAGLKPDVWWAQADMRVFNSRMLALVWLTVIGILIVAELGAVVGGVAAGLFLHSIHQEVAATRSFAYVRRYGVKGALIRFLFSAPHDLNALWPRTARSWRIIVGVTMIPVICFIAAFLPTSILDSVLPHAYHSGPIGYSLMRTADVAGVLAAVIGTITWFRGLGYLARPGIHRGWSLPRITLLPGLSLKARDRLVLNIFWHSCLRLAIYFATAYPLLFFSEIASHPTSNQANTDNSSSDALLNALLFIAFLVASSIPPAIASMPIERRMASVKVSEELCLLLQKVRMTEDDDEQDSSALIIDPLRRHRRELSYISRHLLDAAQVLDARQFRNVLPHPISTLLRAVARDVRRFLTNEKSLRGSIPAELVDTLTMTVTVLSGPRYATTYKNLARRVSAFGPQGEPADDLDHKSPARLSVFAGRSVEGVKGIAAIIVSLATIFAIFAVCIRFALHQMNIDEMLRYLP